MTMSFSNKERTLSMQEGGGGSEGFYQFFKKCVPEDHGAKYFMA